ncbi:hypothetical protein SEA_ESTES_155 [Mycobacterium phage Estes]|uniref:Uncharacterized protein n=1 Tax=Mycobacterium phage Estes TaxID=2759459 RepID=A0A7G9A2K4_9CAUD|nr:hypothetical protein J4U03_gp120 [Mycobacterium phage Estes]QNL30843.1 hypothetical protein SEA_ESTES_155 [Mycobacterium phage Estes]
MARTKCAHCGNEHICHADDGEGFVFTVKITGLDLDAWGDDFDIDGTDKIRADFIEFARNNIQGNVDMQLHTMGYNSQTVTVT